MYDIAPRLAFVEYKWSFFLLLIYNHRQVDLTTASNTVTSSGFPPIIKNKTKNNINTQNDIIFYPRWEKMHQMFFFFLFSYFWMVWIIFTYIYNLKDKDSICLFIIIIKLHMFCLFLFSVKYCPLVITFSSCIIARV